ncbi:MAG: DUF2171 domain-containing protein [Chloroflexi bacterium]|nr:DUF2171 domain-containing protein [Chloroflexota bacterium]
MEERYIGRILPGQDLCDVNGDKVGTVSHVFRRDDALLGGTDVGDRWIYEDVIEAKTGFLGLGEKLYVPVSEVDDTTENAVFVHHPHDEFDPAWHEKPEYLDRMS